MHYLCGEYFITNVFKLKFMAKNYIKSLVFAVALLVSANAMATTYWISGGYNDWSTADADEYAFTDNGDGTHTLSMDEFYGSFKIITSGGGTWYGYGSIELDTEYTLSSSSSAGNISLPSSDTYTDIVFTLTESDDALTLKVTAGGTTETEMSYYFSGSNNSWASASEDYMFTNNGDGTHTLTLSSSEITTSVTFKIVSSTSEWYGYGSLAFDTEYTITTSGGNCYLASAASTDYILFTVTEGDALTLKVTEATTDAISSVAAADDVVSVKYYNLTGAQVAQPTSGVYIVVKSYANGTSTATKVLR